MRVLGVLWDKEKVGNGWNLDNKKPPSLDGGMINQPTKNCSPLFQWGIGNQLPTHSGNVGDIGITHVIRPMRHGGFDCHEPTGIGIPDFLIGRLPLFEHPPLPSGGVPVDFIRCVDFDGFSTEVFHHVVIIRFSDHLSRDFFHP